VDPSRLAAGNRSARRSGHYSAFRPSRLLAEASGRSRLDAAGLPIPARNPLVTFLRLQRAAYFRWLFAPAEAVASHHRSTHRTDRVCFTPATLLSFHLQGFALPGDPDSFPSPILPCCWAIIVKRQPSASEVYSLRRSRTTRPKPDDTECPLGVLPFEVLPLAAVESASRPLLSRAFSGPTPAPVTRPGREPGKAPQSLTLRRAGFRPGSASEPEPHRPLWGFPPRRPDTRLAQHPEGRQTEPARACRPTQT